MNKNSRIKTPSILGMAVLCLALFGGVSMATKQEAKKYTVEFTVQEWEGLMGVIDQSNAPHSTVKAYSDAIVKQLQVQLKAEQDTTAGEGKK